MARKYDYVARADGSDTYVTIRASSWWEAKRIAEADGLTLGGHELEAPSWNEPEPEQKPRHLRSVP